MLATIAAIGAAIVLIASIALLLRRRRKHREWLERDELCRRYGDYRPRIDTCAYSATSNPLEGGIVRQSKAADPH